MNAQNAPDWKIRTLRDDGVLWYIPERRQRSRSYLSYEAVPRGTTGYYRFKTEAGAQRFMERKNKERT